jgi:hypothetical protein
VHSLDDLLGAGYPDAGRGKGEAEGEAGSGKREAVKREAGIGKRFRSAGQTGTGVRHGSRGLPVTLPILPDFGRIAMPVSFHGLTISYHLAVSHPEDCVDGAALA